MTEQLNKNVTVWCVRHALTTGIFKLTGEIDHHGNFFEYRKDNGVRLTFSLGKKDYCLTVEDAKAAAEELRKRKIKSLEKQLDAIRNKEIGIEL